MIRRPPRSTLFPDTTLSRSEREAVEVAAEEKADADVAARLAAVLVVDPVDLAVGVGRAARGADGGDQTLVGETGVDHAVRSEEHTSELQSRQYLVCRLLLEK